MTFEERRFEGIEGRAFDEGSVLRREGFTETVIGQKFVFEILK